ncbi:hypothetical protein B0T20DRAFT_234187 [Sordaria brevicollis]|uniref:Uncharacterized protein n=1 Tax=Sordaria brevicollis TaxID=83679 RepID=A0AAE0UBC5_SORBR|nr:hypothetical protein B0T20DRAFT_234187 [Sordaria brevicollis]
MHAAFPLILCMLQAGGTSSTTGMAWESRADQLGRVLSFPSAIHTLSHHGLYLRESHSECKVLKWKKRQVYSRKTKIPQSCLPFQVHVLISLPGLYAENGHKMSWLRAQIQPYHTGQNRKRSSGRDPFHPTKIASAINLLTDGPRSG